MSSHEKDFPFLTKEEREFPRMVQVALVHNYCNARCYRCPIGLSNSNVQKFNYDREKMVNEMLPLDFFKLIADNMKGHPRTILRLHGRGEPLLNPGIFDMVSYAKMECEIPVVTMFTNGILLDENASSNLLVSHLDVFDISVDAHNAEIYFKNRGTNNWNRVLDNVKRLVDLREKIHQESRIIVSAVLDEEFESEKEHFKTFWEKLGADAAILRPYHNYAGRLPLSGQHGENSYTPCPQFFNRFSVNTNCEVNLCFHDWNDEYVIGRVEHKDSIQKIWQSAAYEEFRRKEINRTARKDDPLCKDCNIRPDAWNYTYELLLKKTGVLNWDKI